MTNTITKNNVVISMTYSDNNPSVLTVNDNYINMVVVGRQNADYGRVLLVLENNRIYTTFSLGEWSHILDSIKLSK